MYLEISWFVNNIITTFRDKITEVSGLVLCIAYIHDSEKIKF